MLTDYTAQPIVAVKDLARARTFYEQTLGLTLLKSDEEVLTFRTGASELGVYRSDYAGTNQANAVVWTLKGDLVDVVNALKGKGVTFEHYDMPGVTLNGDIHEAGPFKMVWFKDPDGNILHLNEGM